MEANAPPHRTERAKNFWLPGDAWGPESGELTPPLKLFRRLIHDKYGQILDGLYTM